MVNYHKEKKQLLTVTAVQLSGKFGALNVDEVNIFESYMEKPKGDGAWINGGFIVCEPNIFDFIKQGDKTIWEREPLERIAALGQMNAFKHFGFWKLMDSLRDKIELEES